MTQNVSETLNRAADLIEERGWTQGEGWPTLTRPQPELCLEGGIMAALGIELPDTRGAAANSALEVFQECDAYRAVVNYLTGGPAHLWQWNDCSDRTAAEVVEVLRAAAVIEAARETEAAESVTP